MNAGTDAWPTGERGNVSTHVHLAALAGLTLLALVTGLSQIALNDAWHDEAASLHFARLPLSEIPSALSTEDSHGPLYFLALKLALLTGGTFGPVVVGRGLSAIVAAGTVVVVTILGTRVAGRRVGLLAGLLLALCPLHAHWAREIRFYAAAEFLCVLHVLGVVAILQGAKGRGWWLLAGLAGGAALLTFYLTITVLAAGVLAAFAWGDGHARRRVGWAAMLAGAVSLPWFPAVVLQWSRAGSRLAWIPERDPPDFLWELLRELSFGRSGLNVLAVLSALLFVIALAAGTHRFLRGRNAAQGAVLAAAGLPILTLLAVSLVKPMWVTRYFLLAAPFLCIVAASGVAAIGRRTRAPAWLLAAAVLLALIAPVHSAWIDHRVPRRGERWNAAQAWLQARLHPDDLLAVAPGWDVLSVEHYFPGHEKVMKVNDAEALHRIAAGSDRTWLLVSNDAGRPCVEGAEAILGAHETHEFGVIQIRLVDPVSSDASVRRSPDRSVPGDD